MVLEDQSTSGWKFSLSGMVSGLQASVLDSKAINGQATRSPALGHAEKMKNMGQAVCHPSLYALKRGLMLTRVIPTPPVAVGMRKITRDTELCY